MEDKYYITKLKESLTDKQRENALYSMRAFARDLDIHYATLSQVLNGKRSLPVKKAKGVMEKLELLPKEQTLFMDSFFRSKTNLDDIKVSSDDREFLLEESHFKIIAEWEHAAVLELLDLENFMATRETIMIKLDISSNRSDVVIKNLLTAELIKKDKYGVIEKNCGSLRTTEDIQSMALKKSHEENLRIGKKKLDEIEVELRDFSSVTAGVDLEKLPEAKTIIREFRQKMAELLRGGKRTEVYQLAIQFYPLTNIKKRQEYMQ